MNDCSISRLSILFIWICIGGCAVQPPYTKPSIDQYGSNIPGASSIAIIRDLPLYPDVKWWMQLNDPQLNDLVQKTLESSPDIEIVASRIAEARANLGGQDASQYPSIHAATSVNRAKIQTGNGSSSTVGNVRSATIDFNWELDLFGRVRESRNVASRKVEARKADAALVQLSLSAQVIDEVAKSKACLHVANIRERDIHSRDITLKLIHQKVEAGFLNEVEEARAKSDLLLASTGFYAQKNECDHLLNNLVQITGVPLDIIQDYFSHQSAAMKNKPNSDIFPAIFTAPVLEIPAKALLLHPRVVAAEREVASAYADIAVSRAGRYPVVNLSAIFSGQWIRAGGSSMNTSAWSLGPSIFMTIFDGGLLASEVDLKVARWKIAVANLNKEIRGATQDIQNALADQQSANERVGSTSLALNNALKVLRSTEARWNAGVVSQIELEDARRQYASNEELKVNAFRDQTQAWVALIRATANPALFSRNAI